MIKPNSVLISLINKTWENPSMEFIDNMDDLYSCYIIVLSYNKQIHISFRLNGDPSFCRIQKIYIVPYERPRYETVYNGNLLLKEGALLDERFLSDLLTTLK